MKSHKGQLVCQHLENISRDALEKYQGIIKTYVRGRHGIYALFRNGRLYYVGLASNLRNRLKHHLRDRHADTWDRFSIYLTIGDEHLRELEALVLRIASPKGNRQSGKFIRSENIQSDFRKDIQKHHRNELTSLFGEIEKKENRPVKKTDNGRVAVLAPFVKKRFEIRFRSKGVLHKAIVRKDGTISYKGKIFSSPSLAGAAAVKRPTCNGWTTWQYERAPGDWVLLDELRRK